MATPIILGLLQNQWVREPGRVKAALDRRSPEQGRKLLSLLLFQSHSGKRLKAAFGEWTQRIIWENASSVIGSQSTANPAPDLDHVRRMLAEIKPAIVLAFGKRAATAMAHVTYDGVLICGPHPAVRDKNVMAKLAVVYWKLRQATSA